MKKVFISGAFDLFHKGHEYILTEAAELGDMLIIALNDDEDIKERKGESRPVWTLQKRMDAIRDFNPTAIVVEFHGNDELLEMIKNIEPQFLVVGSDYLPENIIGYKEMLSWGGEIKIIERLPNISTTEILKK